jgi:hypothetical protein
VEKGDIIASRVKVMFNPLTANDFVHITFIRALDAENTSEDDSINVKEDIHSS